MKIRANCIDLLNKLSVVEKGLPTKTSIPAIEGIYIEKKGGNLTLCSNNLEMVVKTTFPVNEIGNEDEGATILPKKFIDIVKQLPDSEVEITLDKDNKAEIKSGKSKFNLNCMDAEEYPVFDENYEDKPFFELEGSLLKDMIKKTTFCVSNDVGKPAFAGVLMSNNAKEGFICVASDTYRLAWYEKLQINFTEHLRILVPGRLLAEVGRIVRDDDIVKAYIMEKNLVFIVNEYVISIRLLEEKYPDLSSVFPEGAETRFKINRRDLIQMLNRADLLVTGHSKACSLGITDVLKVEAGSEIGKMSEELSIDVEGGELEEVCINTRFMLDGLKVVDNENISIEFNGAFGPIVIKDEGFKYLVLPIKKA